MLFGGEELNDHSIPSVYGSIQPTAVQIPIKELLSDNFELITKEVFAPFQVIVSYSDKEVDRIKEALENITQNLTAAIVSMILFSNKIY